MSNPIARSEDDAEDVYGWWEGDAIEAGDQVTCDPDEVAVFWDGEKVVTTLGPGRHVLTPESAPALAAFFGDEAEIYVCFVTTSPVSGFEVEGAISEGDDDDDDDCEDEESTVISVTLRVIDSARFVAKAAEIELTDDDDDDDDDELPTLADWIAAVVLDAAVDCLNEGDADISKELPGLARPVLAEAGVELVRVDRVDRPEA